MWSLRNIYLYLVCFVSIILIIFGLIGFMNSLTDIFLPTEYYPSTVERMAQYNKDMNISKSDFEAQVAKEIEQNKTNQKNNKIREIIRNLSIFLVAVPFYLYHWKKIESSHSQKRSEETIA